MRLHHNEERRSLSNDIEFLSKQKIESNCFQRYRLRTVIKRTHVILTLNSRVWCPFVAGGKGDHSGRNLLLTAGLWDSGARQRDG